MAKKMDELAREAGRWVGVREKGSNAGPDVERFLAAIGLPRGYSWCMAFVHFCVKEVDKRSGLPENWLLPSGHVLTVWNHSPKGARRADPVVGAIVIWQHTPGGRQSNRGHCGVVTKVLPDGSFETVEGNTAAQEDIVREGEGVHRRVRKRKSPGSMVLKGFLVPWDQELMEIAESRAKKATPPKGKPS